MLRTHRLPIIAIVATLVLSGLTAAVACNVPVFRFALERWRADPYRVTVFHRGPLSDAERALVDQLTTQQEQSLVNVAVRTVDVNDEEQTEPVDRELFKSLTEPQLPAIILQYPAPLQIGKPIWNQPLSKSNVVALVDSPLRKELVKRLVDGQTAVWLLLEGGDQARDQEAADLLAARLKLLEKDLKLPELTDAPEDNLLAKSPLLLQFSILRVPRKDIDEPLVQMLLHSESDLLERNDPMIFPIFGRGRALLPLIGAGITAENIQASAGFLVGACSCEVKELNPGFDLLLSADWDSLLTDSGVPLLATMSGKPAIGGKPEVVAIPAGQPALAMTPAAAAAAIANPPKSPTTGGNQTLLIVGILAVVIVIVAIVSSLRK